MAGRAADCSAISAAASVSETGGGLLSSGGFFLVCKKPGGDRTREVRRLQEAFAELGFAPPVMITTETCIIGAYPSFQSGSVVVRRHPNGDFIFVCGTCLTEQGVGVAATACLSEALEAASPQEVELMGHYAVVFQKNGATGIKLDRFGGYHLFYNLDAGIVSSSFYVICSVLGCLTLLPQSAYEFVFNGVVSGNETLFGEVALAPIGATIRVSAHGLEIIRPALRVIRTFTSESREASLGRSAALLDRYFGAIARSFG